MTNNSKAGTGVVIAIVMVGVVTILASIPFHIAGMLHEPSTALMVVVISNAVGILTFLGIKNDI